MGTFAHLHLHSQYSLLDGAIRLKDLYPRLHDYGMNAVALTDHGNMFGALDFYKSARKAGIKPIFGCEVYVADGARTERKSRRSYHFVLLAKNLEGYKNLTYLVSKAYLEGFYYNPRVDKQLLKERSGGLIGLSACLGGEAAQSLLQRGSKALEETIREYRDIFEPGSYFLEVQPNGLTEQEEVNEALTKMAARLDVGLVATNDCHYLDRKDAVAHDCLMCVQTGKLVSDTNRLKHEIDEYYLKTPEEMERAFYGLPQALENAAAIAEMCNVELDLGQTYLPRYQVPAGRDLEGYLAERVRDGLERRFAEARGRGAPVDERVYRERVEHELGVIRQMGFSSYFLIVWDFINHARQRGVPVGPGRGSGAGSLVAYALRITDLDPIPYNLLFERFLNPERVSMPDFDIDFCMNRRDEVIQYVTEKYGQDNVGQIVTMQALKARGVTRDVARVMGFSFGEADKVAKLIPEAVQGRHVTIPEALAQEPRLKQLTEENPRVAELLDIAAALEGLNRHAGIHAAGIVIGEKPLWEYVPCFRGKNGELVTQFAKNEVEEAGLVKFDFLGLKTLTILDHAVRLAGAPGEPLDLGAIPIDDGPTYEMVQRGDTTGVFQLESRGFKELLTKLKPDCFEDIIAAVALYRPGPLEGGMVDDFIARKHGRKRVTYLHPCMEPILRETYGVIVYQEQVMQIASAMAGFSLGQADILRRAMGKKKPEEMAKQKEAFLAGAREQGVDERIAGQVFDLMEKFAGYGFNKSHSAAYALISYQTAYLKCHYPHAFMAAVLTSEKDKTEVLARYVAEVRKMGIVVERPDVNESDAAFTVVAREGGGKVIRFGLGAVRNVGDGAVDAIIEARADGPFAGLFDFCERVDARRVNRRVLETLIKAGAFDGVAAPAGLARAQLMEAIDAAQERAATAQRDRETGQTSLLGLLAAEAPTGAAEAAAPRGEADAVYPEVAEWEPREVLAFERESLGFYLSGHPLDRYEDEIRRHANATAAEVAGRQPREEVRLAGMVADLRERPLRSGNGRWARFKIEDRTGQAEAVVFSRAFDACEAALKSDEPVLVTGKLSIDEDGERRSATVQVEEVVTLAEVRQKKTSEMLLALPAEELTEERLEALKRVLLGHVGECRTRVSLTLPRDVRVDLTLSERYSVSPSDHLLVELERIFGAPVAALR